MATKTKKDAKDFEALKNIGLELEAPQDEYSYQPGSSGIASGAVAEQEYGVDVDLDAAANGEAVGEELENPTMPIPGESSWSQNHRLPMEGAEHLEKLSDEDLLELVEERLDHHPQLGGLKIAVIVNHGAVALRGRVPSEAARLQAGELVEALPGVTDIRNSLEVERDEPPLNSMS